MYKLVRPLLFIPNPEFTHNLVLEFGKIVQNINLPYHDDTRLHAEVFGLSFRNPVGLAAGFDKNAELMNLFYSLGFGFVEVGSVTANSSEGNKKPRLFRLSKDQALVNRLGLNSRGADKVYQNLQVQAKFPVGINIAKTNDKKISGDEAVKDYLHTFATLSPLASYVTLNISCPNTEDGRTFEDPKTLDSLLFEIRRFTCVNVPVLVKLSPDLSEESLTKIIEVCDLYNIDGYIVANTSSRRENLLSGTEEISGIGLGGLSGKPIQRKSTQTIKFVHRLTQGKVPIIGVGGIDSAESAYEKIKAGASLIQLYTGLIYQGPMLARRINKGLIYLLERDGLNNISKAVGVENI